jgi:geranylgeranyl diphosphate synthase type I
VTESVGSVLDVEDLRERVQKALEMFLDGQMPVLDAVSEDLAPVLQAGKDFLLDGGKRLRPAFAYWGWRGAGGEDTKQIVVAAAALELLHACALIHDDVMDASDTRRGRPSVHRRFESTHGRQGWHGDPAGFGLSAAILLGDMCLVWADQMLNTCGLPAEALLRGQAVYDRMRVELMAGQYLDVLEQAMGSQSVERSLRVARFKSAKYTVDGPLRLGAALAGGPGELLATYSAYGVPLGEAFQLRDDVLGVFGDPGTTGKPAGDDLREGKRTVLVATALDRAGEQQAALVRRLLGDRQLDDDGVAQLRAVIVDTGALDHVETLIADSTTEALCALEVGPVAEPARSVLRELASAATSRRL